MSTGRQATAASGTRKSSILCFDEFGATRLYLPDLHEEGLVVVRTWSVRSTSLNYRIQIRTCGKSEDYAQMPSDKKPKLEVKDRAQIQKEIARKELKLRAAEDKILALSDVIKHKSNFRKEKNAHEKAVRVAKARVSTHEEYYALDLARRPPDRGDDIRIYTKMDLSLWEYGQVRDWFNKKADPNFDPAYKLTPAQSGYMIKKDPGYVESHLRGSTQSKLPTPKHSARHISPRSALEPVSVSQAPSPRADN